MSINQTTKCFLDYFNISDSGDFDLIEKTFNYYNSNMEKFKQILQDKLIENVKNSMWEGDVNGIIFNLLSSKSSGINVCKKYTKDIKMLYPYNGKYYYNDSISVEIQTSDCDDTVIIAVYKLLEYEEDVTDRNILDSKIFSHEEYIQYFTKENFEDGLKKIIRDIDPVNVKGDLNSYYKLCKFFNSNPKIEYNIKSTSTISEYSIPDGTKLYVVGFKCTWKSNFYIVMNEKQYAIHKLKS